MHVSRIHQVAAHSRDAQETIAFYRDLLGAEFIAEYDPPGLIFFNFSGVRLLLEKAASRATLYFRVDDIDAAFQELVDRGVTFDNEPHLVHRDDAGTFGSSGSEEWMAFFHDPSANILALVTSKEP